MSKKKMTDSEREQFEACKALLEAHKDDPNVTIVGIGSSFRCRAFGAWQFKGQLYVMKGKDHAPYGLDTGTEVLGRLWFPPAMRRATDGSSYGYQWRTSGCGQSWSCTFENLIGAAFGVRWDNGRIRTVTY